MANIYESDTFNIVSVYLTNENSSNAEPGHGQVWFCEVQRLPESSYPLKTEIFFNSADIPITATRDDFIALAPSLVATKLSEFDAQDNNWTSSAPEIVPISTQKFTD